jgi:hypothetical protein
MGCIGTCHCLVPFLTYVRTNSVPVRVGTSSCVPRGLSLIPYPIYFMLEGSMGGVCMNSPDPIHINA